MEENYKQVNKVSLQLANWVINSGFTEVEFKELQKKARELRELLLLYPIQEKVLHGHPRFYDLLKEIGDLHSEKNAMYATDDNPLGAFYRSGNLEKKLFKDSISNKALCAALGFMGKQIDGVYEMVGESKANTPDGLEDKLRDIAVYSLISIILIEEEKYERLLDFTKVSESTLSDIPVSIRVAVNKRLKK